MANLTRSSTSSDITELNREMDRFFNDVFAFPNRGFFQNWTMPPMDMFMTDNDVVVKAAVPNVNPDDLEINVTDRTLTIHGQYNQQQENQKYQMREMTSGSFSRSVSLPVKVDADHAQAACENGVLTITLPKAEEARPKRISVNQNTQNQS